MGDEKCQQAAAWDQLQFRKDAKLAASIGLALSWTGWQALLTGTFAGFALAAVYGGVLLATHRASRTSQLPPGPFILLGALAAIALLSL